MTTTLHSAAPTGLTAFPPRRAAALRRTAAPALVGVLAHTITLLSLVGASAARNPASSAGDVLAVHAPVALTVGLLAALTVIVARRQGHPRAVLAGLAFAAIAVVPLAGLVSSGIFVPSSEPARYLGMCIPFAALSLAITLTSIRPRTAVEARDIEEPGSAARTPHRR